MADTIANIIDGGIFVATVIAAIIAWRSVRDARDARDEAVQSEESAAKSRNEAVEAATRSASASERSASALERQVALAEDAARVPAWTISEASAATRGWRFTNTSGDVLRDVQVSFAEPDAWALAHEIPDPISPGQSFVIWGQYFNPGASTVELTWTDAERTMGRAIFGVR